MRKNLESENHEIGILVKKRKNLSLSLRYTRRAVLKQSQFYLKIVKSYRL